MESDTDADADGLPDAWEIRFIGSLTSNAEDDLDADAATNWQEFQAGTDPMDPGSLLRILSIEVRAKDICLRFTSEPGRRYQLEHTEILGNDWDAVGSPIIGDRTVIETSVPNNRVHPVRFLRIRLLP